MAEKCLCNVIDPKSLSVLNSISGLEDFNRGLVVIDAGLNYQ